MIRVNGESRYLRRCHNPAFHADLVPVSLQIFRATLKPLTVESTSPMGSGLLQKDRHFAKEGSMNKGATWEILSRPEQWRCPLLRRDWLALVDASDNLNLMYQSPEWF